MIPGQTKVGVQPPNRKEWMLHMGDLMARLPLTSWLFIQRRLYGCLVPLKLNSYLVNHREAAAFLSSALYSGL